MTEEELAFQQRTDAIIAALKRKIGGDFSIERSLRMNPTTQQLLAMSLNALVHHSKETLMLMEACKLIAQRAVEGKQVCENCARINVFNQPGS